MVERLLYKLRGWVLVPLVALTASVAYGSSVSVNFNTVNFSSIPGGSATTASGPGGTVTYVGDNNATYDNETMPVTVGSGPTTTTTITSDPFGTVMSSTGSLNLGGAKFSTSNPSPVVGPSFTISFTPTVNGTSAGAVEFYGWINTNDTVTFSTSSTVENETSWTQVHTVQNYFSSAPTAETFVYKDLTFGNLGTYAFGIVQTTPNLDSPGKFTPFYAVIAPASMMTPEPASLTMTAVALCGLLGLAVRRRVQAARS